MHRDGSEQTASAPAGIVCSFYVVSLAEPRQRLECNGAVRISEGGHLVSSIFFDVKRV